MKTPRSVGHSEMHEMNLVLILNSLREAAPVSRTRLAGMTGLSKATVSGLIKELSDRGFVSEVGTVSIGVGRPSVSLQLNPEVGSIIGAEIGVDFLSVILTDFSAKILWRYHENTAALPSRDAVIARTIEAIRAARSQSDAWSLPVFGLGIGVPGLVDSSRGHIMFAPNLGWTDVPLRRILKSEFGFPVYVENEANLAALCESYFGAARNADFALYVSSGIGLGGGIVLDRRLVTGAAGFAGEFGHMTVDPHGRTCKCGNIGCWETLASQSAVFQRVKDALTSGRTSSLSETAHGDTSTLTFQEVAEAASSGDEVALEALEETGRWLGVGIASLVNALNPELVVFGGILSLGHKFMLPAIRRVLQDRALQWPRASCEVVVAMHGTDACLMGGVTTVHRAILSAPSDWT